MVSLSGIEIPKGLSKTWSIFRTSCMDMDIDYAQLLVSGKSLSDVCPDLTLVDRWVMAKNLLKSHYKAITTSKIDLGKYLLLRYDSTETFEVLLRYQE
jgi:hypothetical protein